MAEYIERKPLLECAEYDNNYRLIIPAEAIKAAPAADVTPVVRCKNCVHYDLGVCLKIYSDGNAHPEAWQSRNPDDFCSYGERKDC